MDKLDTTPSLELQLESATRNMLSKEVAEKTRELRQLRGEELQGLNLEELKQIEKLLKRGLSRVKETKDERCLKEISSLKRKGAQLKEENQRLKQAENLPQLVQEIVGPQGQPSRDPWPHGYNNSSDISLTLGCKIMAGLEALKTAHASIGKLQQRNLKF
ncbi:hypothetical protein GQ457_15G012840 [Hibiscus cannabinus]